MAELEVGTEVEYSVGTRNTNSNHNMVAENVKALPPGTIKLEGAVDENAPIINGVVKRSLRSLNPDQKEYSGLIQELGLGIDILLNIVVQFEDRDIDREVVFY